MTKINRCLIQGAIFTLALTSLDAMAVDIAGQVTGPDGYPLPGVTVSANLGGASPVTQVTDGTGKYRFLDVDSSDGSITFALEGFTTLQRNIGPQTEIDAQMQLSSVADIVVTSTSPVLDTRKTGNSGLAFSDLEFAQQEAATAAERLGCAPSNLLGIAATTIAPEVAPAPVRSQIIDLNSLIICLTTHGDSGTVIGTVLNNGETLVTPDKAETIVETLGPFVDLIATLGLPNMQLFPGQEPCFPWTTAAAGTTQVSRTISLDKTTSPPTPYTATVTNEFIDFELLQEVQIATSREERRFANVSNGTSLTAITRRDTSRRSGPFLTLVERNEVVENSFNGELLERYTETITFDPAPAYSEGDLACTGKTIFVSGGNRTVTRQYDLPNQNVIEFTERFDPQLIVVDGFFDVDMAGRNFTARKEFVISMDGNTNIVWTNQDTGMAERVETHTLTINSEGNGTEPPIDLDSLIDNERLSLSFPYLEAPVE